MMPLNSYNSLPQSAAAKGTTATLSCLISNISASNLLICISGGTDACLSCSSVWPCVHCQSVCLSLHLSKSALCYTHRSTLESARIEYSLQGTNMSHKQRILAILHILFMNHHETLAWWQDRVIGSATCVCLLLISHTVIIAEILL